MTGTSTGSVHLLALLFRFAHKTAQKVLRKLQVFASSPREVCQDVILTWGYRCIQYYRSNFTREYSAAN